TLRSRRLTADGELEAATYCGPKLEKCPDHVGVPSGPVSFLVAMVLPIRPQFRMLGSLRTARLQAPWPAGGCSVRRPALRRNRALGLAVRRSCRGTSPHRPAPWAQPSYSRKPASQFKDRQNV